jgi:hypothetical protein
MKLRLDFFLSIGGELAESDELYDDFNNHGVVFNYTIPYGLVFAGELYVMCDDGDTAIYGARDQQNLFITSFAPRKNIGEQPCGDDVVSVALTNGSIKSGLAENFEWTGAGAYVVQSWNPDLEALIKMQAEPVKPRVKVEYVRVNANLEGGKYWECAREFAESDVNHLVARTNPHECPVMSWMNLVDNDELLRQYKLGKSPQKIEEEVRITAMVEALLNKESDEETAKKMGLTTRLFIYQRQKYRLADIENRDPNSLAMLMANREYKRIN